MKMMKTNSIFHHFSSCFIMFHYFFIIFSSFSSFFTIFIKFYVIWGFGNGRRRTPLGFKSVKCGRNAIRRTRLVRVRVLFLLLVRVRVLFARNPPQNPGKSRTTHRLLFGVPYRTLIAKKDVAFWRHFHPSSSRGP